MRPTLLIGLAASLLACRDAGPPEGATTPERPLRIISIGAGLTEGVIALGAGELLVGVDRTSTLPEGAPAIANLGLPGQLSAEGIAELAPDLILLGDEAGPPQVLDQLRAVGIGLRPIHCDPTPASAAERLETLGEVLGRQEEGKALADTLRREVREATAAIPKGDRPIRALFLYARGHRAIFAAGQGTPAHAMLTLAGADNVLSDMEGMKAVSGESLVAADPEVIVMPKGSIESLGGPDGVLALSGLAHTAAARHKRVVGVDDLALLGFGPRMGAGLKALVAGLYALEGPR